MLYASHIPFCKATIFFKVRKTINEPQSPPLFSCCKKQIVVQFSVDLSKMCLR